MRSGRRIAFSSALMLLICCPGLRADDAAPATALFRTTELLEVQLRGPMSTTIKDRKDRGERAFVLEVDGTAHDVWVRVRGNSRSRRDVCAFPPLRLRFENAEGLFAGQHKVKLVTHCRNSDSGDANAMEEFLAYRIFNLLTPSGFRVRPLQISYDDSDGRLSRRARQRYGFLIESKSELESRLGGTVIETAQISLGQLDPQHAALVYVFQYLIGNTDWSLVTADDDSECCHNGRPLRVGDLIRYVPYDFDLAGLVNASYAEPDPRLHLRNVRTRRYRGFCTEPQILRSAVGVVMQREEDIYTLVRTVPGLDEDKQKDALKYLARFFDEARDGDKLYENFEKRCLRGGR